MRIALAQINPTVGDLAGNTNLVFEAAERARADGADLIVLPELAIIGYPPRDLLLREGVVRDCEQAVRAIAEQVRDIAVVVGHPRRAASGVRGVCNSASLCFGGEIVAVYDKRLLPGYDIFDEDRYFDPGDQTCTIDLPAGRVGILTCEDLWQAGDVHASPHYAVDPVRELVERGCDVVVSPNASPFIQGKFERHVELMRQAARRHGVPIVAVNQVGANDDLVFEGRSFAVSRDGAMLCRLPAWEAALEIVDTGDVPDAAASEDATTVDHTADVFDALVLAVRDYCRKTRNERVLIGLSGGIDSSLVAVIAAAAIGPENVTGVMMPSRYSSPGSRADAKALARNLGLGQLDEIGIEAAHETMRGTLDRAIGQGEDPSAGRRHDGLTDENIQARLRGLILMARSNASGAYVLATGNKSELAVGYATLYGDMCGAVAVIGDLIKRRVYEVSRWINAHATSRGFAGPPIPERSITKPPSAELRPDQTDQDSLPPYDLLDTVIERYVEREESADRIIAETGFDAATVQGLVRMIDRAEFKRYQAAIIPKVTERAFGRGRAMPLVMNQTEAPVPGTTVREDRETRA